MKCDHPSITFYTIVLKYKVYSESFFVRVLRNPYSLVLAEMKKNPYVASDKISDVFLLTIMNLIFMFGISIRK